MQKNRIDKEAKVSFKIYKIHILPNISRRKSNQAMKFGFPGWNFVHCRAAVLKILHKLYPTIHVKGFIHVKRDPSIVLPGFRFAGTKNFHVITSDRISGMKRYFKRKCKHIYANTTWKTVPSCLEEAWFPYVIIGWNLSRLDGLKFHLGKSGII